MGMLSFWFSATLPAQTNTNADAISREVSLFNFGPSSATNEAISREVSLFNLGPSSSTNEAISREVSVFNLAPASTTNEAISREVSLFNLGPSSTTNEAISREVSVANLGPSLGNVEAISREVSLFNLGVASPSLEGISREVSVYVSGKPVLVTMGGLIIGTGTSGQVPIYLATEVALTNVEMSWVTSPGRVTGVTVEPIVPQICSSAVTPQTNGQVQIEFTTCPGQSLVGTQQIAWLMFTLPEGQLSAFVYPSLTNQQVSELNGFTTTNSVGQFSRLVVLDDEPLLEMLRTTNLQPLLVLYGKPATNYAVEWSMSLPAGQWQPVLAHLTIGPSLFLEFAPPPGDGPYGFYRGVRGNGLSAPPLLLAFKGPNGQLGLSLRGQPGYLYGIDRTASISSLQWSSWEQIALTNASATIYVTPVGPTQFYRARLIGAAGP